MVTETARTDAQTTEVRAPAPSAKKPKFRREWAWCWLVVAIPFIGYVIFNIVPVVISVAAMFTDIEHNQISTMQWNNFAHFVTFFHDAKYWHALGITLWLTCAQFLSLLIALAMATLINTQVRSSKFFQILYFVPYICSTVAVSIMWSQIFSGSEAGVLNSLLGTEINWIGDANWLTWCIFIVILWPAPGYGIVMFTAAFKGIDPCLYEAAEIDGANAWQRYIRITLPQIAPMTLFLALAGWMSGMATFDQVRVLAPITWTGTAGVDDMGLTVAYYTYVEGITFSNMDYASVLNWVTAIITMAGSFLFLKWRKKTEENIE